MGPVTLIREHLSRVHYHILYKQFSGFLNYHFNPFPTKAMSEAHLSYMPEDIKLIMKFWALGERITLEDASSLLGERLCQALIDSGLCNSEHGFISLNKLVLVCFDGYNVFVNKPTVYGKSLAHTPLSVYIGPDTYYLHDAIPRNARGALLELCSGSAACSIAHASQFETITCVEIDPHAHAISKLNIALNCYESKIVAYTGSLFEPIEKATYDLIIANPPFIPVPREIKSYPICGAGGEDGMAVINGIIRGVDRHLNPGGQLIMFAEGLADAKGLLLNGQLAELVQLGYHVEVYILSCCTVHSNLLRFRQFCEEISLARITSEQLQEYHGRLYSYGAEYYATYVLLVTKPPNHANGSLDLVVLHQPLSLHDDYVLAFEPEKDIHESGGRFVVKKERNEVAIDRQCFDFVSSARFGKLNVGKYLESVRGDLDTPLSFIEKCQLIADVEAVVCVLGNQKLLRRKEVLK